MLERFVVSAWHTPVSLAEGELAKADAVTHRLHAGGQHTQPAASSWPAGQGLPAPEVQALTDVGDIRRPGARTALLSIQISAAMHATTAGTLSGEHLRTDLTPVWNEI